MRAKGSARAYRATHEKERKTRETKADEKTKNEAESEKTKTNEDKDKGKREARMNIMKEGKSKVWQNRENREKESRVRRHGNVGTGTFRNMPCVNKGMGYVVA